MSLTGRHTLPVNNIHQNIYHYDGARASYSSTGMRKGKKKISVQAETFPRVSQLSRCAPLRAGADLAWLQV